MNIKHSKSVKWIGGGLIAIIIGAVGSGFWQHILGPALSWFGEFLLNVGTLGIQSFKNSIYQQIAQNHHEEVSLTILALMSFFLGVFGGVFIGILTVHRSIEKIEKIRSKHLKYTAIFSFLLFTSYVLVSMPRVIYLRGVHNSGCLR